MSAPTAFIGQRVSIDQWHCRLGHPLSKHHLSALSNRLALLCPACQQNKMHKLHFGLSLSVFKDPLGLIYLDLWALQIFYL